MDSLRSITTRIKIWRSNKGFAHLPSSRALSITCRGDSISREELFRYSNGRFLFNEKHALKWRHLKFDVDRLCEVAALAGGQHSPVCEIEKMEGGFSKALLMRREDGSEVVAKLPFPIAGPPKYTTASEVAVLRFISTYTKTPVPRVLAWNSDSSNPVGVEYIIMEKAPGLQLFKAWGSMKDMGRFNLVTQLQPFESELSAITFPASGSLYLQESMTENETFATLTHDIDPEGLFCIGPSCDRGWWQAEDNRLPLGFRSGKGPWPKLASYGKALAEREMARIMSNHDLLEVRQQNSIDEEIAVLKMFQEVMSQVHSNSYLNTLSRPILWHTDLHMGNIYVSSEEPRAILSFIDWQSIDILPLFLQARFPEFLTPDDDYALGAEFPKLPDDFDQLDADDKEIAKFKFDEQQLSKAYELKTGSKNAQVYRALHLPLFLREMFARCADASGDGVVQLRECLIQLSKNWNNVGFTEECPLRFTKSEIENHNGELEKVRSVHTIQNIARKLLDTDIEGWISPYVNFAEKQQQNRDLLELIMDRSSEYNMTPEEVRMNWPFLDSAAG